ncbi:MULTISPECIES: hypothetical protein [unclassified Microbacterium]|uniref:hypothetical protein n=1 Tax=unclassified Microbacterium TaxID=2609290 RepID=UPI0012FC0AFC|nr:hypothetical protein [Microbacterium sp. MAH-37]MVQ43724.1 hypothetical protein [Microbacterium sp. MAH-37]
MRTETVLIWSALGVLAIGLAVPMSGMLGDVWSDGTDSGVVDEALPPAWQVVELETPEPVVSTEPSVEPPAEPVATWKCGWDPTYNDDWHDDVLCTKGMESDRPALLPEQEFITKADMMVAAREYEKKLNG